MSWIEEYLKYTKQVKDEKLFNRFAITMYPTGWQHYGINTIRDWAIKGLKELKLID